MSKIVNDNIGILDGMTALYGAVSDESSMDDVVVVKGCSPVTNDPKVKTIVLSAYTREPAWNIQNKTHWCYATAALIMVSSSIDVQDYKYMKPSIKNELDEYRKGEKVFYKFADGSMIALTEYNKNVKGIEERGVRDITSGNKIVSGFVSGKGYYCDSDQEYVVNNYSYESVKNDFGVNQLIQKKFDNKKNNNAENSARYTLQNISSWDVKRVFPNYEEDGWVKAYNGELNEEYIRTNFVAPLTEGKGAGKLIVDAGRRYVIEEEHTWGDGHTYIVTGIEENPIFAQSVVELYDCWTGEMIKINEDGSGPLTLYNVFKRGFYTKAYRTGTRVFIYLVNYLCEKQVKQEELTMSDKPKETNNTIKKKATK